MEPQIPISSEEWALARRQHWVIAAWQLSLSRDAINHLLRTGRLFPLFRGVYSVGRPEAGRLGWWMASVLACGPDAALSHDSAAALWRIRPFVSAYHVSTPADRSPRGIVTHRRRLDPAETTRCHNIPVTSPVCTLIDIAPDLTRHELEGAVNEADKLDLVDPEHLRAALVPMRGRTGVTKLRDLLDRRVFTVTDSELERLFLPIARRAGLPQPLTQVYVNGFKVDFYWPDLGLVVETDGLRYHRAPAQQARDRLRDQVHAAAGLI